MNAVEAGAEAAKWLCDLKALLRVNAAEAGADDEGTGTNDGRIGVNDRGQGWMMGESEGMVRESGLLGIISNK